MISSNQTTLATTMECKCLILKWQHNTLRKLKILTETERWVQVLLLKILMLLMKSFLMSSKDHKTSFKEILKKSVNMHKPKFKQQPTIKPSILKQTWEWMTETQLQLVETILVLEIKKCRHFQLMQEIWRKILLKEISAKTVLDAILLV